MSELNRGALCLKIGILTGVFAGVTFFTWRVIAWENTVGLFVTGIMVACALLSMFFVLVSGGMEKTSASS